MIFLFEIIKLSEIDTILSPFFFVRHLNGTWYEIEHSVCVCLCTILAFLSLLCQIFMFHGDISMKFQTSRQFTAVDCLYPVPLLIKYTGKY